MSRANIVYRYWHFLVWSIGKQGLGGYITYIIAIGCTLSLLFYFDQLFIQKADWGIFFILYPLSLGVIASDHYTYFWKNKGRGT